MKKIRDFVNNCADSTTILETRSLLVVNASTNSRQDDGFSDVVRGECILISLLDRSNRSQITESTTYSGGFR